MDLKLEVYRAAHDGNVEKLTDLLESHPQNIDELVNSKTNGATPLNIASRNGHLEVVRYFIEKCMLDIETASAVEFEGEKIEKAPPLWCAAAAGYFEVVGYLISKGANVNNTTATNSTPLRAACFDGHIKIVKYLVIHGADIEIPNRHGHTCLMIACYKKHYEIVKFLIETGANVNRSSTKGNTAMHDSAEAGSLNIMMLLIAAGAEMMKDCHGLTPLLTAAVSGHSNIVAFLTYKKFTSRQDNIDAYELLGATYIDKKRDLVTALQYWKIALEERTKEGCQPLPKEICQEKKKVYDDMLEVSNLDELQQAALDPDIMRTQALLVRERLLGPAHPDTFYHIRHRGAVYADLGDFKRGIALWMYALTLQQTNLSPLDSMTQSSFLSFAELFSFMTAEGRTRISIPIPISVMQELCEKSIGELKGGLERLKEDSTQTMLETFDSLVVINMHFVSFIHKQLLGCTKEEMHDLKAVVYRLVVLGLRGTNNSTPLHLAANESTSLLARYPVSSFPSPGVTQILLEMGSDANAIDNDGETPLHVACRSNSKEVMEILLANGAHFDAVNDENKPPMELLDSTVKLTGVLCPINYLTLQCLAAQAMKKHNIPYVGQVSVQTQEFLNKH